MSCGAGEEFPTGGAEIASLKSPDALQHNFAEVNLIMSTIMRMTREMSVKRVMAWWWLYLWALDAFKS